MNEVKRWKKVASEGIFVIVEQGKGSSSNEIYRPQRLIVNEVDDIHVTDSWNDQIHRFNVDKNEKGNEKL